MSDTPRPRGLHYGWRCLGCPKGQPGPDDRSFAIALKHAGDHRARTRNPRHRVEITDNGAAVKTLGADDRPWTRQGGYGF